MNEENAADSTDESSESDEDNATVGSDDDEPAGSVEATPGAGEAVRRTVGHIRLPTMPQYKPPTFKLPELPSFRLSESAFRNITGVSRLAETQANAMARLMKPALDMQAYWDKQFAAMRPMLEMQAKWEKQFANFKIPTINSKLFKAPPIGVDFNAFAAASRLAEQQSKWLKNLGPAIAAMRANFYPPNLRAIEGLELEEVEQVVMADGIPLYGVPRTTIAEALIRADSSSKRRDILGRRWTSISADCRAAVEGCTTASVAPHIAFVVAALDALDAGHTEAAQALAGSLVDTVVNGYFGDDRYKYTPSKKTRTNEAYNEFTIREFIAFAPIWQTYQQFFVSNGDKIPGTFSRHATAHAVGTRQYNRRNAIQGLMMVCSLLYRFDEEARVLEPSGGVAVAAGSAFVS